MGVFSLVLQQPEYRETQVFVEWLFGSVADLRMAFDCLAGFVENRREVLFSHGFVLSRSTHDHARRHPSAAQ